MLGAVVRRSVSILLLFAFSVCMASVLTAKDGRGSETKHPIVVIAQQQQGHEVYRVDSVAAHDLLRTLGLLVKKRGPDYPVIVLLDWNSPVSGIFDVPPSHLKLALKMCESLCLIRGTNGICLKFAANPACHSARTRNAPRPLCDLQTRDTKAQATSAWPVIVRVEKNHRSRESVYNLKEIHGG